MGQSDLGRLTWAEEYRWFESNQVDHFCKFTIKRLFKFSLNILLLFVYFHFKNVILNNILKGNIIMKIPETYEEYLKTPKDKLKQIIESDGLTFDEAMKLYNFNKQAIAEKNQLPVSESSFVPKNTLWEELRGDLK